MRKLKTKYPCVRCGEPAEVSSRKEIERAKCARCHERNRLLWQSNSLDTHANGCAPFGPGEQPIDGLIRWLEALERRTMAALLVAKAMKLERQGAVRPLAIGIRERLRWVLRVSGKLDEQVLPQVIQGAGGLEAIDGGGERAMVCADPPALKLVRGGDEP